MNGSTMRRVATGVLISGRGSNMAALLEAARDPAYPSEIVLVVANRSDAAGLEVARSFGVEAIAIDHRPFQGDRMAHERAIDAALRAREVRLVALAGYMRILTPWLVAAWEGRMLNIHPSLLPRHPGVDTHARALADGDPVHGCSVHLVSEGVDEGPLLAQAEIEVRPGDTAATLAARVLEAEHRLYPPSLAWAASELRTGRDRVVPPRRLRRLESGPDQPTMSVAWKN